MLGKKDKKQIGKTEWPTGLSRARAKWQIGEEKSEKNNGLRLNQIIPDPQFPTPVMPNPHLSPI